MTHRVAETVLPTELGDFRAFGRLDEVSGHEHLTLVRGEPHEQAGRGVLTRVHSECLTGDEFGSTRCDCGPQLRAAMARVVEEGVGVVAYLRGHEGRGIGLADKLRAGGIEVREQLDLLTSVTSHDVVYLHTKMDRFGHSLGPMLMS